MRRKKNKNKNKKHEEERSILTLTDGNGAKLEFEYLDCLEYRGKEYLVVMPADEDSSEIFIMEIEPVDEDIENYLPVEDESTLLAIYEIFKDKYRDVLTFAD